MAEPWVRVHAQLINKPVIARMSVTLRVDPYKAMGHLVTFWSNVAAHATNGRVADIPDVLLEQWAGWTSGKRGAFAKWLREQHIDADGRVNEWDDYAGHLEIRREKDRARQREHRALRRQIVDAISSGVTRDVTVTTDGQDVDRLRDVTPLSVPARANGTERDGTGRNRRSKAQDQELSRAEGAAPLASWVEEARQQWAAKVGPIKHGRVGNALKELVDAHGWDAVSKGMADYLTATPLSRARLEWFAEAGTYWIALAQQPLVDPETCQPTERMRVVVDGKRA